MSYFHALILGIIQGIAEFFPISSSAHLHLTKIFLHISDPSSHLFDLTCHLGTLFAALIFFRRDIAIALKTPRSYLLFGSALIPLVFVYFFFKSYLTYFSEARFIAPFFLASSLLLFTASKIRKRSSHPHKLKDVLFIGSMQCMALLPGISRSGSTIAAGLFRGWEMKEAIRFSFLLAIPTVLGGTFLETMKVLHEPHVKVEIFPFLIGFIASFMTGLFSVRFIFWSLNRKRLKGFAIYLLIASVTAYVFVP